MINELDVHELLHKGIEAAKAAQKYRLAELQAPNARNSTLDIQETLKTQARRLLLQVTELDETNVQAWLWLSAVMDELIDKYTCLENVLSLDPHNEAARAGMQKLTQQIPSSQAQEVLSRSTSAIPPARLQAPARQINMGRIARLWAEGSYEERSQNPYEWDSPEESDWYQQPDIVAEPKPATPSAPAKPPQARCPFCHKPIASKDLACRHCALALVMDCPKCNTLMDVEQPTCTNCGHDMGDYGQGADYFIQLAAGYRHFNRSPKALAALKQAEKINPEPDLYRQIGEVQAELGRIREAVTTLKQAIDQEPSHAGPYLGLGKVFQQEGQWEQAEQIYKQALQIMPKSSEAHVALGDLYMQRGQTGKAQRHLQQATRLDRQNGLAWARLGQLYDSMRKRGQATRAYRQAYQWLPHELSEWHRVQNRLQTLDPRLPQKLSQGWSALIGRIIGPILICLLAILLASALQSWSIGLIDGLALGLATIGAILWVSAVSLPKNPLIQAVADQAGLEGALLRFVIAVMGAVCWLLAMGMVLWPLMQMLP